MELMEEYMGGDISPAHKTTHEAGTVMVPAEYIARVLKDLDPDRSRYGNGTKKGWIKHIQDAIKTARGARDTYLGYEKGPVSSGRTRPRYGETAGWRTKKNFPVELVPFNIDEFWNLQNELIEIVESKQTREAMGWTKSAAIARFLDKTGVNTTSRSTMTERTTFEGRMAATAAKVKQTADSVQLVSPTPNTSVGKSKDTL